MAIVTSRLKDGSVPSEETLARIKDAAKYEVTFDEDCPELTDQELSEFKTCQSRTACESYWEQAKEKQDNYNN